MPSDPAADLQERLPLRPVTLAVLLVLRRTPLHGYAVMERVNEHLGKRALVGPGTLYRTLKELREDGLLRHAEPPGDPAEVDGRRSYYTLTDLGRQVAAAEVRRLAGLLDAADARALLAGEGRS